MSPTPAEEITELRAMAVDWQKQFHELSAAIEAKGFTVEYGDHGKPIIK